MQTIARANRVFGDKPNGLIVDYIGVFANLQRALAIYGAAPDGTTPVQDKSHLIAALREALTTLDTFCAEHGIHPDQMLAAQGFALAGLLGDAVEALVVNDAVKNRYLALAANVARLYRAILPDRAANEFTPRAAFFAEITRQIHTKTDPPDISAVMKAVEQVLDESIAPAGYRIREPEVGYDTRGHVDLSQIDFARLQAEFAAGHPHTATQQLRGIISARLQRLVPLNRTRTDYQQRFEQLIAHYNTGAQPVELIFAELVALNQALDAEAQRHLAEHLSEEELALFDLLTKPDPGLSSQEKESVKHLAQDLLTTLKREKLVLDWRKRQQARASVRTTIQDALDRLPPAYTQDLYQQKCDDVYQHIYDAYYGSNRSLYATAA
jgi:type I restriction enzyme R subunit